MYSPQEFEVFLIRKGLQYNTRRNYLGAIKAYHEVEEAYSPEGLEEFLTQKILSISPAGVNKYCKAFRYYCEFIGAKRPDSVVFLKERRKDRITLSDPEIEAMIAIKPPPSKWGTFWQTLAYTGMRPGELAALRISDIDLALKCIHVHHTKTGRPRTVPLIEPNYSSLCEYLKHIDGIFAFPVDKYRLKHIKDMDWLMDWRRRKVKCGIMKDAKPYSLRHSYITNTLQNGAVLFDIQDNVGHSSADTTKEYYHGNLELMRKAAQKLPLAQNHVNPREIVTQVCHLIDEFLKSDRYDPEEILEAKKHLYRSVKG